jgi:response regulator of citrate/malate metabolism
MKRKLAFFLQFLASGFNFFRPIENYSYRNSILFINENTNYSRLTDRLLAINGFKILEVHTFRSARTQLLKVNVSLILMEENLSDGSAIEFLKNNQSLFDKKEIVFISADQRTNLKNDLNTLGIYEILPRSFQVSDLNKVLYKLSIFNNTS